MTEVLRQSAHVSKRLVAIVDEGYLPHIEDKWQRLPRELRSLESFLKDSTGKIEEETGFKVFNYERKINTQETWLEFIEKQVILDVLMEPYIYSNFVRYQAFPYDPEGFMGKETALLNVFTFWEHYQQKYVKKLKGAAILEEEFDKYMMEEGYENK